MASGICTGTRKMGSYSAGFTMIGTYGGDPIEFYFPLYSPDVVDIRMVQPAFVRKGKGTRVRRAKLYYLKNRPISELRIPSSAQTREERAQALEKARQISAAAKMGKKQREKLSKAAAVASSAGGDTKAGAPKPAVPKT